MKESEGEARGGGRGEEESCGQSDLRRFTPPKGGDWDPPRCKPPNCFCLAAANCCGSLLNYLVAGVRVKAGSARANSFLTAACHEHAGEPKHKSWSKLLLSEDARSASQVRGDPGYRVSAPTVIPCYEAS